MSEEVRNSQAINLIDGPVGKTLTLFSVPFVISTLLQTLYSTVDTVVVGQVLGKEGLSAVSNGSQLMQMIYMICIGFSTAGQVLIAQAAGAKKYKKVQKIIGSLCVLEILFSLVLSAFCVCCSGWLLDILHTPEEARQQAAYYVIICGVGVLFTGMYNMFSAILRGLGDSKHPLLFVVISTSINLVLDLLFVIVFHWNVAGAALATIIGQLVSVIFSIVFLSHHEDSFHFRLEWRMLKAEKESAVQLVKLGVPMCIQSAAVQSSFLFVSHMVNNLGLTVSAAFGAMLKIRNIPGVLTQGFGLGASSMIGQNLGAKRQDRVKQTVNWCIFLTSIVNLFFGIFFALFPELCFRLFTQDADVLDYAGICMFALILELFGKSVMPACNALVSAQGFVQFGMVVAFLDAFAGRVFLCWLFGSVFDWGALGFFLGYTCGTYMTAIPVFVYYISGLWKKRAVLN
ncbi:MAG: MATE family efflux transporter [Faecousia sp.]